MTKLTRSLMMSSKMRYEKKRDCFGDEEREEKERATRVRCLREGAWISIRVGQTHAYSHERETVRM